MAHRIDVDVAFNFEDRLGLDEVPTSSASSTVIEAQPAIELAYTQEVEHEAEATDTATEADLKLARTALHGVMGEAVETETESSQSSSLKDPQLKHLAIRSTEGLDEEARAKTEVARAVLNDREQAQEHASARDTLTSRRQEEVVSVKIDTKASIESASGDVATAVVSSQPEENIHEKAQASEIADSVDGKSVPKKPRLTQERSESDADVQAETGVQNEQEPVGLDLLMSATENLTEEQRERVKQHRVASAEQFVQDSTRYILGKSRREKKQQYLRDQMALNPNLIWSYSAPLDSRARKWVARAFKHQSL